MPTPSRVGAVPARASRVVRGPAALLARATLLLGVAALPIGFNAWIDPARLVAPRRAEREIARVLATGTNVTSFANYDDRAIEKHRAPMRARPEVLVLGSSRMQVVRGIGGSEVRGSATAFVNGAMQGGVLDDMLGVYGLYDAPDRRPRRVLLGVDPWTESARGDGWRSVAEERAMVMRRAGIAASPGRESIALWARSVRTLATPEYFRLALYSFRRHGTRGIAWQATERAQNAEKTKMPDGSVTWSSVPEDDAGRAAREFALRGIQHDARFRDLDARAAGRKDALERFVRYAQQSGVSVTIVLVPFPAEVYDAFARMPGRSVRDVERDLRALAARTGSRVAGSYDPRRAGVVTREFFDETHLRPEPLARLLSSR